MTERPALPVALPVAYLRVYEPLEAFGADEQRTWRGVAASSKPLEPPVGLEWERGEAVRSTLAVPPRPAGDGPNGPRAFVRFQGGITFVCPWDTRLRSLLALAEASEALPEEVVEAFWPPEVIAAGEWELERLKGAGSRVHPHVQSHPWWVPTWWFVPFAHEERQLTVDPPTLRYTTSMAQARRRTARGLAALRHASAGGPVVTELEALGRWLEEFHPRSLIELDYDGVAEVMGAEALIGDESVSDVATGLAALRSDEVNDAVEAYRRIEDRWEPLRALQHSS